MFKPVQFGKYYLTERLAVGGMAEIFKAKLYGVSGFEKPMVVKQILPQYARNTEFIKMFIDEAKIAVSLTHGNIIPVYELGRIDGVYFIAMEYVHGKNLAEILESAHERRMLPSVDDSIYITIEVCKGLDYAHRRADPLGEPLGLVHRDISPPNVMVSMTGEVKLADFGIAKATHKLGDTQSGVVKGTYGYMSPEQLTGDSVDHRTDIFNCGILLYEMLTGRRLFDGGSDLEAMARVKEARVPAPSTMSSRVPAAIDPIVARALAKDPADRYGTANELQLELSRLLFSSGGGGGASATTLTEFIKRLFPSDISRETPMPEPLPPQSPVSNRTQSYAVRDVIEEADRRILAHQPRGTGGAGLESDRTMGLPALSGLALPPAEGLAPLDIEPHLEELEEEKTAVFRRADEPQKPDVPELRFSAPASHGKNKGDLFDQDEVSAALDSLDTNLQFGGGSAPGENEFTGPRARAGRNEFGDAPTARAKPARSASSAGAAAYQATHSAGDAVPGLSSRGAEGPGLADLLEPSARDAPSAATSGGHADRAPRAGNGRSENLTARAASMSVSKPQADERVAAPPRRNKKRPTLSSDEGLMALMTQTGGTGEVHSVGSETGSRRARGSGVFSSTMRFFVDGLEEQEIEPQLDDKPHRTIKPTVIGWVVILTIVLGAVAFVIYKKTSVFSDGGGSGVATLDPSKKGSGALGADAAKAPERGTLVLVSSPPGAHLFLHVGDSPITTKVDVGLTHLVRAERQGYRTVHKAVDGKDLASGKGVVRLVLAPVGANPAAAHEPVPAMLAVGARTGKLAELKIETDPPAASAWLLVGKGRVELSNLEAKRHYFKAVLAGHETAFVTVLGSELAGKRIERSAKLEAIGAGSGSGSTSASGSSSGSAASSAGTGSGSATTATNAGTAAGSSAATANAATPTKAAPTKRRPRHKARVTPRRRTQPRRRPKRTKKKKKKKKKKKGLTLPSWAK